MSQSTNVLIDSFFLFLCVGNGPFGWPITKNLQSPPSSSRNHNIVLHLKIYKCIFLQLHLHCFTQHKIDLHDFTLIVTHLMFYIYMNVYGY
jgi:hypothetical protein